MTSAMGQPMTNAVEQSMISAMGQIVARSGEEMSVVEQLASALVLERAALRAAEATLAAERNLTRQLLQVNTQLAGYCTELRGQCAELYGIVLETARVGVED